MGEFDFSYFDSRLYSSDIRPYSSYVIQSYAKGRGWIDEGFSFTEIQDAILWMKRLIVKEYEHLRKGQMDHWRIVCRTDVPVMFDWNTRVLDLRHVDVDDEGGSHEGENPKEEV